MPAPLSYERAALGGPAFGDLRVCICLYLSTILSPRKTLLIPLSKVILPLAMDRGPTSWRGCFLGR